MTYSFFIVAIKIKIIFLDFISISHTFITDTFPEQPSFLNYYYYYYKLLLLMCNLGLLLIISHPAFAHAPH